MSSSSNKKISFNELSQEEEEAGVGAGVGGLGLEGATKMSDDNIHSLELTSNMINPPFTTFPKTDSSTTTSTSTTRSSSRRGRTINTILIGPAQNKKCFQITFVLLAIFLLTIAILTFVDSPSSDEDTTFKWPPPQVTASYDPSNPSEYISTLNTKWKPTSFTSKYIPDKTYYQRTIMETDTSIHAASLGTVDSDVRFLIDSQMEVISMAEEEEEGAKGSSSDEEGMEQIEYTVTHLQLSQMTNGHVFLEVDSDNGEDDLYTKKELSFVRDMIGHTSVLTVDENGKIISSTDHEGLSHAINTNQVPNQLSASQQYHSISHFTQMLPEVSSSSSSSPKVKVGDTWPIEMNVEGNDSGIEYYADHIFAGKGTLLGYTQYDGVDVSVIYLEAIVENVDISLDIDDLDEGGYVAVWADDDENVDNDVYDGSEISTTIKSGTMSSLLYWDYTHHYPRWYKGNVDLIISMPNPMSSTTGTMMDVPTHEEFEIYMKMRK